MESVPRDLPAYEARWNRKTAITYALSVGSRDLKYVFEDSPEFQGEI